MKVHFNIKKPNWQDACNKNTLHVRSQGGTIEVDKVTCESCKKTKAFIEARDKEEKNRPLEKEEFEEPKKLSVEYIKNSANVMNLNSEQYNALYDFTTNKYSDYRVSDKRDGYMRIELISYSDFFEIKSFINNGFREPPTQPKTKLELAAEKYNLNEEQKEYLSGFDYEVVVGTDCRQCIFTGLKESVSCDGTKCDLDTELGSEDIIFKQIHKSQESLNKAIEKEDDKQPMEEPFGIQYDVTKPNYKPEDVAFKDTMRPSNHSSHYEDTKQRLECIDKQELIICHRIPEEYHELLRENFNCAMNYKYGDRLGSKDNVEKEIDKMKNYINRSVKGEWRK